ncbi:DUF4249 domain-containing protein [Larkinella sp. C7]|jgi:hypothetical protein|uniref:DUF4249 domain-containing protein n=1 Tax=Larkinella sp. C7 TaxID=2576607 RepID=UPI0011112871|nr:DUF4249 domain-containing protein [Larkinella sp. C7]
MGIQLKFWTKFLLALMMPVLLACDDEVDIMLGSSTAVLNIDAWVNNKSELQTIKLTLSQPYFENDQLPPGVSGARVRISDDAGNWYDFTENERTRDGSYTWMPATGEQLGIPGRTYQLIVDYQGETFEATCRAGRVPPIDSITYKFEEGRGPIEDEYRAEFWGNDLVGKGDTYWIKTYKNGKFINKASEINIAYDAGISSGNGFDGVPFISPVRGKITPNEVDSDGQREPSIIHRDSLYVEIHSISLAAFNYLNEVIDQTDKIGGLSELFTSTPMANVSTNLANQNPKGSSVVGFFNVAVVSGKGKRLFLF